MLVTILCFLTMLVLFAGLFVMAKGGEINKKYSNKLMILRVVVQFAAIATLVGLILYRSL